jgi:hypothetical protein
VVSRTCATLIEFGSERRRGFTIFFRGRCPGRGGGTGSIDRRPARPPTCSGKKKKGKKHARLVVLQQPNDDFKLKYEMLVVG